MSKYDFSEVDFSQQEIIDGLARAYTALLKVEHRAERLEEGTIASGEKQRTPKRTAKKRNTNLVGITHEHYDQERMF